jgi:urease accessory protein
MEPAPRRRARRFAFGIPLSVAVVALLMVTPAAAHHVMDRRTPGTLLEGLLSGLGHPIIGLDHLAFIIGVGIFAAAAGLGPLLPVLYVAFMLAGLALHLASVSVPGVELMIGASVTAIGTAIMIGRMGPGRWAAGALFSVAGTAHGFAFAESLLGAETGVLAAYAVGLALVQSALALAAYRIARVVMVSRAETLRMAGLVLLVCGSFFVIEAAGFAG